MSRSNSGTKSFSWSPVNLKIVRRVFGVGPSAKSRPSSCLTSPWPFAYLERYILGPTALSRTWCQDDDWEDEWHVNYNENPKFPSRSCEKSSQRAPTRISTKQQHFNVKPLCPSTHTASLSAIELDDTTTSCNYNRLSNETSITDENREKQARFDAQFGPIGSHDHRYVCQHMGGDLVELIVEEPPYFYLITTYISYMILIAIGRVRDFFGKRFKGSQYKHIQAADGYAALNSDFDNFFFRRLKVRMNDCFSRPYGKLTPFPFPVQLSFSTEIHILESPESLVATSHSWTEQAVTTTDPSNSRARIPKL